MRSQTVIAALSVLIVFLTVWGCTQRTFYVDPSRAGTGRYSTFPSGSGWKTWPPNYLVMVMTTAQYEVTRYNHVMTATGPVVDPSSPTGFALIPGEEGRYEDKTSESIRGAGLILRQEGSEYLILTCRHVVNFPEKLRYEIVSEHDETKKILIGEGERKRQTVFVGWPGVGQIQASMVASSETDDLALLRANLRRFENTISPSPFPLGASGEIRAGDGVYILGAPRGKFQVTWGIATPGSESLFFVDTSTPPGYSGGPVVGISRESGRMELVGIITGSAGKMIRGWEFDDTIVPGLSLAEIALKRVTARETKTFDYGVTHCITVQRIRALLRDAGTAPGRIPGPTPENLTGSTTDRNAP